MRSDDLQRGGKESSAFIVDSVVAIKSNCNLKEIHRLQGSLVDCNKRTGAHEVLQLRTITLYLVFFSQF